MNGRSGSKKGRTQSYPYKYVDKDENSRLGVRRSFVRLTPKRGAMDYTTYIRGTKGATVGRKLTSAGSDRKPTANNVRTSIGSGVKKGSRAQGVRRSPGESGRITKIALPKSGKRTIYSTPSTTSVIRSPRKGVTVTNRLNKRTGVETRETYGAARRTTNMTRTSPVRNQRKK